MLLSTSFFAQDYEIIDAPFNSDEADFSGVYGNDFFLFCSTRARTNLSFLEDTIQTYFTDLYVVQMSKDANGQDVFSKVEPLKGNVNTLLNEGQATFSSDGQMMIYTGNMKQASENKVERVEEYKLGLFTAQLFKDSWLKTAEFPYNSRNGKYSVAHPCLSAGDSILYFASNMPGGYGGSDIYRSYWRNNMWSQPENLGDKVNSKGNEFFPFINEYGILFFSTDAREDSEGMDIYYSLEEKGKFIEPQRLNNTINSEYDEFAYSEKRGAPAGSFSSNRNGGVDDVFLFAKYINNFKDCFDNEKPSLCYHLVDEKISKLSGMPFKYEWNMGDGTVLYGNEVDHCYNNYGNYKVRLNIIDTTTKQIFASVSDLEIDIRTSEKPYILVADTTYANSLFMAKADFSQFKGFDVDKIEWEISDGAQYKTAEIQHTFKTPGTYEVKMGLIGKRKGRGVQPRICVYKTVVCLEQSSDEIPSVIAYNDSEPLKTLEMKRAQLVVDEKGHQLSPYYRLVVAQSKTPMSFEDARFSSISEEITELKTDSGYQYTIGKATTWEDLVPQYQALKNEGLENAFAEIIGEVEYDHRRVRTNLQELNTKKGSLAANNQKSVILLRESATKLGFDNIAFSKVDGIITEIKTENGYAYIIEPSVQFEEMQNLAEQLKAEGVDKAQVVSFSNDQWSSFEKTSGSYEALAHQEEPSVERISAIFSEIQLDQSMAFEHVEGQITEIKTENGYMYVLENGATFTDLTELAAELQKMGYETAEAMQLTQLELDEVKKADDTANKVLDPTKSYILVASSKTKIADGDVRFQSFHSDILEVKTDDGYQYVVEAPINANGLVHESVQYEFAGITDVQFVEFTDEQWKDQSTGRVIKGLSGTDEKTKYIAIAESDKPLYANDNKFQSISYEVFELKQDDKYVYVIEAPIDANEIAQTLEQLKMKFEKAEVVEFTGFQWDEMATGKTFNEEKQPIVASQEFEYRIKISDTSENLKMDNDVFKNISGAIIKTAGDKGYAYYTERALSAEELQDELAQVKKAGFMSAEIVKVDITEFRETVISQGVYTPAVVIPEKVNDELFTIVFAQSDERLPMNNDTFKNIGENILEMKQADGTGYQYAVRTSKDKAAMEKMANDYIKKGLTQAKVEGMSQEAYNQRLIKIGKYIDPRNAQALNVEFSKLADIQFEYNSAEIRPESYSNLNYIASMLLIEEDFSLRLSAHTCNIGGEMYNQDLSQRRAESVVKYLISKGVRKERLFPKGYGQSKPKADNTTEDGRKINRRVEFVIIFNTRVTPK